MPFFKDFREDLLAIGNPDSEKTDFYAKTTNDYNQLVTYLLNSGISKEDIPAQISRRRLLDAMEANNIQSGAELVEKSGVNKGSISQYLNGLHVPSSINAKKIADVLGVNPLWLMAFDAPMHYSEYANSNDSEPLHEEIIKQFSAASPDIKMAVLRILGIK